MEGAAESQRGKSIKDNNEQQNKTKTKAWEEVKGWGIREEAVIEAEM